MRNRRDYPLKRNHYFYGKLLTVRDFEDEQLYYNSRMRLNGLFLNGAGVVSGLDAVKLDDKTVSVEAGMALDYAGRLIVVPDSVTKRLEVLDGYEEISNPDEVYLCLKYQETQEEQVHSLAGTMAGENVFEEYNRIGEGYCLYLTDLLPVKEELFFRSLIEVRQVLYSSDGITVTQALPRYVKDGQIVELRVTVEKKNAPGELNFEYEVSSGEVAAPDGSALVIRYCDEEETPYSRREFAVPAAIRAQGRRRLRITSGVNGSLLLGNTGKTFGNPQSGMLTVITGNPADVILGEYRKLSFDELQEMGEESAICLARLRMIKKERLSYLEEFEPMPFGQYCAGGPLLELVGRANSMVLGYLSAQDKTAEGTREFGPACVTEGLTSAEWKSSGAEAAAGKEAEGGPEATACGEVIVEIDLRSAKKAYYSDEIMHGLGCGDVFVQTAVCDTAGAEKLMFGDPKVFDRSPYQTALADYTTGILLYPEKGTFRIGIRFSSDAGVAHVKLKWWAYRKEKRSGMEYAAPDQISVRFLRSTAVVKPKENFLFETEVTGAESQDCRFRITDEAGGFIDSTGLYTAPAKEGVYEIEAESIRYPGRKAYAYAVVKKD